MKIRTIEGVLRTVSPLHISSPEKNTRWDPTAEKYVYGKGGFPLTQTRTSRFFLGHKVSEEGEESVFAIRMPIIPASTWRGMLRRGAARVIEEHVIGMGAKLSYEAYQGLHCGAVSGKPDGIFPTTDEILSARRHVFYGIFGGGPRMLAGALKVSDSIPVTQEMIQNGILPQEYLDDAQHIQARSMIEVRPVLRKDDFYTADAETGAAAADVVQNYRERFEQARRQDIERAIAQHSKAAKEEEGGDAPERGVRAMSFMECVPVGLPLRFQAEIKGTDAQVGMLLAALQQRLPQGIGGRAALGFGKVSGVLYIREDERRLRALEVDSGQVRVYPEASQYMEALQAEVAALSLDDIERYMKAAAKSEGVQ